MTTNEPSWKDVDFSSATWEGHEKDQILFIAKNTTPLERLQWLEETLQLLYTSGHLKPTWERPPEK